LGQPVRIVDPATGTPFAGSAIPAGRISPQAAALLAYYPRPAPGASGPFNYEAPIVTRTRQQSLQSRAAYTINNRNQINGSVSYQRTDTDATTIFGFDDGRNADALDTQVNWMHRFAGFTTLRTRYQYTRTVNTALPYFANSVNVSGDAGIQGN